MRYDLGLKKQLSIYGIIQPHGSFAVGEINAWIPVGKAVEWHLNIMAAHHMIYTWLFDNKKVDLREVGCS